MGHPSRLVLLDSQPVHALEHVYVHITFAGYETSAPNLRSGQTSSFYDNGWSVQETGKTRDAIWPKPSSCAIPNRQCNKTHARRRWRHLVWRWLVVPKPPLPQRKTEPQATNCERTNDARQRMAHGTKYFFLHQDKHFGEIGWYLL